MYKGRFSFTFVFTCASISESEHNNITETFILFLIYTLLWQIVAHDQAIFTLVQE